MAKPKHKPTKRKQAVQPKTKAKAKQKPKPTSRTKSKATTRAKAKAVQPKTKAATVPAKMKDYEFLRGMYADSYFPKRCVDKIKQVLLALCVKVEASRPPDLAALYALTHAATERINDLQDDFDENDSEIETGAREAIAADFAAIATAYGFEADMEELIATRDW